jgi:hypothetical protein
VAATATITIFGDKATGSYTFSDNEGVAEDTANEDYEIQRSDDATGTNITTLVSGSSASDKSWTLTSSENGKYLRFCVAPASKNRISTSWHCSSWTAVGELVELYQNTSFGGTSLNIAYQQANSGTCFTLTDYAFNDEMSSFAWATGSSATTLTFYKDVDCSGSSFSSSLAASSSTSESDVGSTWNDQVSSFRVGSVTASDQELSMNGTCYGAGTTLMDNGYENLVFQGDGNLVLYRTYGSSSSAVWGSGTNGKNATSVCLQTDGNMVVYGSSGALWASGTNGSGVATLKLQSDCNLVLYTSSGVSKWGTGTNPC